MEARISARISTPGNEFKKKPKMVDSLRLDAVLEAVKLPTTVSDLDTALQIENSSQTTFAHSAIRLSLCARVGRVVLGKRYVLVMFSRFVTLACVVRTLAWWGRV